MAISRRTFLKISGGIFASLPIISSLANNPFLSNAFAAELPLAKPGDGMAKNLKYCDDADKAIKAKTSTCVERKDKARADQYCRNCQLFQKAHGEGKDEVGKCLIM